jgi:hypothetical protein
MAHLRIFHTGVRDGEFITSSSGATQNKGTVMQIRGLYPPSVKAVNDLDEITLRDTFNQFSFFSEMSSDERLEWLTENAVSKSDLYMDDVKLELRFVKIGGKFFTTKLDQEQLDTLLRGNPNDPDRYWPIREVYDMFPSKAGSKGVRGKHTLIFRPNNWSLMAGEVAVASFDGLHYNLDTFELKTGPIDRPQGGCLQIVKVAAHPELVDEFAIVSGQRRSSPMTWDGLKALAGQYGKEMEEVKSKIDWFPPSLHKSLIQKIIRTRCRQVKHTFYSSESTYLAGSVLLCSLSLLMLHPGSFVPNIQRFVSGLESVKRLAVSICEDSWLDDVRPIVSMYAGAMLAQQDRTWQPSDELIGWWFYAALTAQKSPKIFKYDSKEWEGPDFARWDDLPFSYLLLAELRSFESDIRMVGSIAENKGEARVYESKVRLMDVMPLTHCVDHHSFTEIALYTNPLPEFYTIKSPKPYASVFGDIWSSLVGVNPRLEKYAKWDEKAPNVVDFRNAQRLVWLTKVHKPLSREGLVGETVEFKYRLDPSWIAGLVGPIEIKIGHSTAIVVLRPDDITRMTAIKKASRDAKVQPELTEEEKTIALNKAIAILRAGIHLRKVPTTLPQFKDATVFYKGSHDDPDDPVEYWIRSSSQRDEKDKKWSDAINLKYVLPVHSRIKASVESALLYTGDGISKKADEDFDRVVTALPANIHRRLATYLEGNRTEIKLHKISRDGSGVDYTVLPEDVAVNQTLCYICCWYPAALVKQEHGFRVKNGPLMWSLRDRIVRKLREKSRNLPIIGAGWPMPVPNQRKAWEHQLSSLELMKQRHEAGKRGHEIWLPPGVGKTFIFCSYLAYRIEKKDMPACCAYSLPPSAVDSIQKELDMFKIPHQLIDMRISGVNKKLKPGMVNLVLHDHMRLNGMDDQLKELAPQMLFVIDEFHKTMAKTIRTSIALEVMRLSEDFVCMSGTIIKDSDSTDELIQYLEQIVEYEVTPGNWQTAFAMLISRKVVTNIVVERVMTEAKLVDEKRYYSLVPRNLGGIATRINFRAAVEECWKATDAEKIFQTIHYVREGEIVFLLARDVKNQHNLRDKLFQQGLKNVYLITKDTPITLLPGDIRNIQVVITTPKYVEGYTLVASRILIQDVWFGNQATRDQLEGRINRLNQPSSIVMNITVHCGILTYVLRRYETARSLSEAMKGFASDLALEDIAEIRSLLV